MKKICLMILTLLLGISSISFASDDTKVSHATLVSFEHDFKKATGVSWTETGSCYKATFNLEGQVMYAYYDKQNAELIALTRFILSSQLPLNLQQELRGQIKQGWVADLFEVVAGGETFYYATIESASEKLVLKSSGFSDWAVSSSIKK